MAVNQDTTNDQLIFFSEDASGRYSTATKAELISTGKFKPEWFPGTKGNKKTSVTIEGDALRSSALDPLIAKLRIERSEKGRGFFDVALLFTDEEEERRSQIHKKEIEERAYKEASDLAKRWIDGLPDSVDAFKKHSAWQINNMMTIHFNEGSLSKRGGYSFDKKVVREFDLAVDALCNILLNGKVNYYQFGHEQKRRDIAAEAFNRGLCLNFTGHERDALVQRFMRELAASEADAAHVSKPVEVNHA